MGEILLFENPNIYSIIKYIKRMQKIALIYRNGEDFQHNNQYFENSLHCTKY